MKLRQLLYLIKAGDMYKIGISKDVNKRMESLQTGNAHKVVCIAYYKTEAPAMEIEKKLHNLFNKYRMSGEWFDFQGNFTQEKFDTICPKYGMTRMDFNEDGTCKVVQEVEKPGNKLPKVLPIEDRRSDNTLEVATKESAEYWRNYYGIGRRKRRSY